MERMETKVALHSLHLKCRKCSNPLSWGEKRCEKCRTVLVTGFHVWFPLSLLLSPVFLAFSSINFVLALPEMVFRGIARYIIGIPDEILRGLLSELLLPFLIMIFVSPYPRMVRVICHKGLPRSSLLELRKKDWGNEIFADAYKKGQINNQSYTVKAIEFQNQWSQIWHGTKELKYRGFRGELVLERSSEL